MKVSAVASNVEMMKLKIDITMNLESTPKSRANGIKLRYFLLGKNLRKPYL